MKLKNQALRTGIRATAFLLLLGTLFAIVAKVTGFRRGDYGYALARGFLKEPRDSLDAVIIGGSDAYTFWEGALAWHKYGIAVRICGSQSLPIEARPYFVEVARKTQPNALYVILLRPYGTNITPPQIHHVTDNFPLPLLKMRLIRDLADRGGYSAKDRVAFYIPFIQYHTYWLKLNGLVTRYLPGGQAEAVVEQTAEEGQPTAVAEEDAVDEEGQDEGIGPGYLQHVLFDSYRIDKQKTFGTMRGSNDMTAQFHRTEERAVLSDECVDFWNGFLDDLDANKTRVLFVIQATANTLEEAREYNSVKDLVTARGYPVLDLTDRIDEIGLDLKTDYLSALHLNIHGGIPYTDYMARYLIENYGFEDKRGQPGYESWDEAYDLYMEEVGAELSDEEIAMVQ